jgi:Leucine-rich repeat (LRR) protein
MKKTLLILVFILAFIFNLNAQNVYIPDTWFKTLLVGNSSINTNADSEIQVSEAIAFNGVLDVASSNVNDVIYDLTGISAFINIVGLNCYFNQLTSLDLSANTSLLSLNCSNNQLTSLNISGCTALEELRCGYNDLTSLNVSANTSLSIFYCNNNQLTSLNISNCTNLNFITCSYNLISSLDLTTNTSLSTLFCSYNPISFLNISGCTTLENLFCQNNQLTSLNVLGLTALQILNCNGNQLTSLNVSNCLTLINLNCGANQLTTLNLQNGNNQILTTFNSSGNPSLICIQVDDTLYAQTQFTNIDSWANFSTNCNSLITGNVKDVEANLLFGNLDLNNCVGCSVNLYQGATLINTQTTDNAGNFSFSGLSGSNYNVVAETTIGSYTYTVTYINVNPGDVLTDIKIPATLIGQTNEVLDSLQSKIFTTDMFYNLTTSNVNAIGYNEAPIENFVSNCENIQSNYDAKVDALGHLLIAQSALKEFADDAAEMTKETIVSSFDFGEVIYSLATINKKLENVPSNELSLIEEIKKYQNILALKTIKYAVVQSWDYVGNPQISAQAKTHFQSVMDLLIEKAESNDPDDFSEAVAYSFVRDFITSRAVPYIYSNIYIPATQTNVASSAFTANTLNFQNSFSSSFMNVLDTSNATSAVSVAHNTTINTISEIETLRNVSNIADIASGLALRASVITTLFDGGTMLEVAALCNAINILSSASALGKSIYRLYELTNELPIATYNSFRQAPNVSNTFSASQQSLLSTALDSAIISYNNHLSDINSAIASNQRSIAISKIDSLLTLDSLMQNSLQNSLAPIYAAAPYVGNSISNFDSLYNFSIIAQAGASMYKRQAINYNLIAYLMDSTNTNIADSINQNVTSTINANNQIYTNIQSMNDSLVTIAVPANLFVTDIQYQKPMSQTTNYPVTVYYQNVGATIGTNIYAKLILNDGFTTSLDSIYIGTVGVGDSDSLTFSIFTPSVDTIGTFSILFYSPNTTSDGIGGAFVVKNPIITKIITNSNVGISVYPNPTNSSITITNVLGRNIQIVNALGQIIFSKQKATTIETVDLSKVSKGIYFVRVTDENETINQKFIKE